MKEHAAAIAREHYEDFYCGCGMTDEESKEEAQRMAVWNLQSQHLSGERYIGNLYDDGTIHYWVSPYTTADQRTIRASAADPYIFRVRDEYHQLYIDYVDWKYPPDAESDEESDDSIE